MNEASCQYNNTIVLISNTLRTTHIHTQEAPLFDFKINIILISELNLDFIMIHYSPKFSAWKIIYIA